MEKEKQLEVIKFLKSPEYQKVLKKYKNRYDTKKAKFEDKYESNDYSAGEPIYSELALQATKVKIFTDRLNDIKWDSEGADIIRGILEEQINNIKSHLLNSVTNSFGGSKDIATFTEDDLEKFKMLHDYDFHIFIVGMLNPKQEMSLDEKYDIYEDPEEQL